MLTSSKALPAPKEVPKKPIVVSELAESSLEEGTKSSPLDVPSIQAVGVITVEGRAAKHTQTSEPSEAPLSSLVDKGKNMVEHLSSALNNELLNEVR